jgi:hypothetical protein
MNPFANEKVAEPLHGHSGGRANAAAMRLKLNEISSLFMPNYYCLQIETAFVYCADVETETEA